MKPKVTHRPGLLTRVLQRGQQPHWGTKMQINESEISEAFRPSSALATFHVFSSHMWLMAAQMEDMFIIPGSSIRRHRLPWSSVIPSISK